MNIHGSKTLQLGLVQNDSAPIFSKSTSQTSLVVSQRKRKASEPRGRPLTGHIPLDMHLMSSTNGSDTEVSKIETLSTFTLPLPQDPEHLPQPHPSVLADGAPSQAQDSSQGCLAVERKPGIYDSMLCSDVQKIDEAIQQRLQERKQLVVQLPGSFSASRQTSYQINEAQRSRGSAIQDKAQKVSQTAVQAADLQQKTQKSVAASASKDAKMQVGKQRAASKKRSTAKAGEPFGAEGKQLDSQRQVRQSQESGPTAHGQAQAQRPPVATFSADNFAAEAREAQIYQTELVILKMRKERLARQKAFRSLLGRIAGQIFASIERNSRSIQENKDVEACNALAALFGGCRALSSVNRYPVAYLADKINAIADAVQLRDNKQLAGITLGNAEEIESTCEKLKEPLLRLAAANIEECEAQDSCSDVGLLLQRCQEMQWQLASVLNG